MRLYGKKIGRKRMLALFGVSLFFFALYMYIYVDVLGWELPKTKSMKMENAKLRTRAEILMREMNSCSEALDALELRDEDVYRSIFGLSAIPRNVREGGFSGVRKNDRIDSLNRDGRVGRLCSSARILAKRAYIQSRSYDEIEHMLNTVDNMSSCIPVIAPVKICPPDCYISSSFGYRYHPLLHYRRLHTGMDFAVLPGCPVYATGDATVEKVRIEMRGYGHQVVLDHGFGYKTRYAHMKTIIVNEGMKVKRGEMIGTSGNSGLSSGPHLHYEVMYRGKYVNPFNYFDRNMPVPQYENIIFLAGNGSRELYVHAMHK